jgi:cyanophycin synthetase
MTSLLLERSSKPLVHHPVRAFPEWRVFAASNGRLPIIGVTGSRGKSSVVRILDAILTSAGLRTATRTDSFVEIRGKRQRGEIAPWRMAKEELGRGTLDIAIEEIDWLSIQAMGIPRGSYPAFIVTNVCGNRDACLIQGEARRAAIALPIVFDGTAADGDIILTGDEIIVSEEEALRPHPATFVGLSRESPALRGHLASGGTCAWSDSGKLAVGSAERKSILCGAAELDFALAGKAGFQIQNALMASAAASAIGISIADIGRALQTCRIEPAKLPGSFHFADMNGISIVLDRPNPSWFLRSVLRTIKDLQPARVITVVGRLGSVPFVDVPEVGRLLGRSSAAFVMHSMDDVSEQAAALKQGAAANEFPPMIVHAKGEGRALSRALAMAKPGDLVFVLSERQEPLHRLLYRRDPQPRDFTRASTIAF